MYILHLYKVIKIFFFGNCKNFIFNFDHFFDGFRLKVRVGTILMQCFFQVLQLVHWSSIIILSPNTTDKVRDKFLRSLIDILSFAFII